MSDNKHSDHHEHHVEPLGTFIKVFVALIVLTGLTVLTSMFDFGIMNIVIAMLIAVTKSFLVIMFFMQLKFDNLGNKVTFTLAFVFLAVFIMLTGSDLFFRAIVSPLKVAENPKKGETDQNKLRVATPALLAKGKEIYKVQCVTCHGENGYGDGPAAAAANPKPRNYHTGYWRYGGTPTQIFHTLTVGSPGTAMAAYSNLSIEDRYALVHYVRTMAPNPPNDSQEDLKKAGLLGGGKGNVAQAAEPEPIPIEMAMDKLEVPDQVIIPPTKEMKPGHPGAQIFQSKCMSCHGPNAVGAQLQVNEGQNPRVAPMTRSWSGINSDWTKSQGNFVSLVSHHFPGGTMVGVADLTREEWAQVFEYSKELTKEK